jgi:hypothetical protein
MVCTFRRLVGYIEGCERSSSRGQSETRATRTTRSRVPPERRTRAVPRSLARRASHGGKAMAKKAAKKKTAKKKTAKKKKAK